MAWHIVEILLREVEQSSTLVGKFWFTFFFVLRFLLVLSIAETVFADEQGSFVCNTNTPGCLNVCYNDFSPISLVRLWALQMLCTSLPTVVFIVYAAHKMEKMSQAKKLDLNKKRKQTYAKTEGKAVRKFAVSMRKRRLQEEGPPNYSVFNNESAIEKHELKEENQDGDDDQVVAIKLNSDTPSRLLLAYVFQVICRLIAEVGFMVLQFNIYVFKFWVPELFKCTRYPCPNVVDCFVSRPKEKTVMLWIMFGTGLIMIVLNILELYHLGERAFKKVCRTEGQNITKLRKVSNRLPHFGHRGILSHGRHPQAVKNRIGNARSSLSGEGRFDKNGDRFV